MSQTKYDMPAVLRGLADEDPSDGRKQILLQAAISIATQAAQIEALTKAIERVTGNFKLAVAGKPVRDMAETLAEVEHALSNTGKK